MGAHMGHNGDDVDCWLQVCDDISSHGHPYGATLVMLVDVGAGWAAESSAGDDWTFTVDIGLRRALAPTERIHGRPTVQRTGRTISIDFPMWDASGAVTAAGAATFIRLPRRPNDPPRPVFPLDTMAIWSPPDGPLAELLGARKTDRGLAVDHRPELLNPAGILQGGVSALLAELAAQAALEEIAGRLLVSTSFDVRYVTMGRVGPFEAVVEPIGTDSAVVKILDSGAGDAVVTHNLISFTAV